MADAITNVTTLGTAIATGIATRTVYYYDKIRLASALIGPEHNYLVPDGQKAVVVNQIDTLTFAARGTQGTTQAAEAFTTVGRTLTPAVHGTNIVEATEANYQSALNNREMYAEAAAAAWAIQEDSVATYSFAANYDDVNTAGTTHVVGADGTAMTASSVRAARALIAGDGGRGPINLMIDPIQTDELLRDAEAQQYLHNTRETGLTYAATLGVSPDRFLGRIHGVYVWEGNGMTEATGLMAIMFAKGAIGKAYQIIKKDGVGTGELFVDRQWDIDLLAHRIVFAVSQHWDGIAFTAGTNVHMAVIKS